MLSHRGFATFAAVTALMLPVTVLAQAPAGGVYTYRHGYNPGYYGSRTLPIDPGAKPGQWSRPENTQYWYIPPNPAPAARSTVPRWNTVRITPFPALPDEPSRSVLFVAHVPEDAELWFEGEPTAQRGTVRLFESPPLELGKKYRYTIRLQWTEESRKVSQTGLVRVHAGEVHCLDLVTLADVARVAADESRIKAALGQLAPEDRKTAEKQRVCALQPENRLGSMGQPIPVVVQGQPVFFCCGACASQAESRAAEILATMKKWAGQSPGPK